jgi:hypothetical protein
MKKPTDNEMLYALKIGWGPACSVIALSWMLSIKHFMIISTLFWMVVIKLGCVINGYFFTFSPKKWLEITHQNVVSYFTFSNQEAEV